MTRSAESAPAFFFIDVQPDQAPAFAQLVAGQGGTPPELIPVVRSRLSAIDGEPLPADVRTRREDPWFLTREYVLTWASAAPGRNSVIAGRWWTPEEAAREPLISVEEELAKQLGVGIGGTLTFDVQGVPVTARVVNLRRVDWQTFGSNFFVIFSPGALDGAPSTFIATARVPEDREEPCPVRRRRRLPQYHGDPGAGGADARHVGARPDRARHPDGRRLQHRERPRGDGRRAGHHPLPAALPDR